MATKDENVIHSQEELDEAYAAIRHWDSIGRPEVSMHIHRALANKTTIPSKLLITTGVKPEIENVDPDEAVPPPRSGEGSGVKNWREFAAKMTTIEPEVIAASDRETIISMLEAREVIQPEPTE